MSDEADLAADAEQKHLAAALRVRQPVVEATGFCAHCNDATPVKAVFCSPECRTDFEWTQKLKRISGC
jgi:hypothetical protein